ARGTPRPAPPATGVRSAARRRARGWWGTRGSRVRAKRNEGLRRLGVVRDRHRAQRRQVAHQTLEGLAHDRQLRVVQPRAVAPADERQEQLAVVAYCSHTGVRTRSKFGCSLKPCTRFPWTITCLPWSTKIHGASSTTSFCASRYSGTRAFSSTVVRARRSRSSTRSFW